MEKITKKILVNVFFFLLIFQSLSAQNSQRIDLSLKEQTLKVFLEIVEQKTNYTFMYNNLDLEQKTSVQVWTNYTHTLYLSFFSILTHCI